MAWVRSITRTRWCSQGWPQSLKLRPWERKVQNTQCSQWNMGMCWCSVSSSQGPQPAASKSASCCALRSYEAVECSMPNSRQSCTAAGLAVLRRNPRPWECPFP